MLGGELLLRYGMSLQAQFHDNLKNRIPKAARPGEVFIQSVPELPYMAIVHAVAVDGWYHSSIELVRDVLTRALQVSADQKARKVAVTALATGYGDLDLVGFGTALAWVADHDFSPIEEIVVCLPEAERVQELLEAVAAAR